MPPIHRSRPVQRVLLIGMMGAGKTTVGRALHERLGWPYLDNDDLVAEATGTSKESLLEQAGVASLREAETAAMLLALRREGPLIAGIAAGVVLEQRNVDLLADRGDDALVVWLRAPMAVLAARIDADPQGRPWLAGDTAAALARLAAQREPGFAAAADLTVDVDRAPLADNVEQILSAVRRATAAGSEPG